VEQAVPGALDEQDPDTEAARGAAHLLAADETQLLYSMVLHGREELALMGDEYAALTMVLLRYLAFPAPDRSLPGTSAAAPREPRAAPLRAPAPPALTVPALVPVKAVTNPAPTSTPAPAQAQAQAPVPAPSPSQPQPQPQASVPSQPSVPAPSASLVAPGPAAPQAPIAAMTSAWGDRWYGVVKRLCEQNAVTALGRELAIQSGLLNIDEAARPPRWTVLVERETLRSAALRDKLQAALSAELGQAIELALEAGVPEDSPAKRDAAERAQRQAAAEATVHADPVVLELLAQFKTARVVPGSIKPL
jgi:DNA polymerase III subunit gamma/tau